MGQSKERKIRRQNLAQFSPAHTTGRVPATSHQRAAPATVPKLRTKKDSTRRSSMHTPVALVPDQKMEEHTPANETVAEAETLATDPEVDSPWLAAGKKSLTKQAVSDGWSDAPETEEARLLAWELCQTTRATKDKEFTKTAEMAHANGKATFSAWVDFHDWKLRSSSHDVVWALGRYISSRTAAQAVKDALLKSTATSQRAKRVCLPSKSVIPPHVPSVPPPVSEVPTVTVTPVEDSIIKAPSTPAEERQMWEQAMKASLKEQAEII
jgi:hypothetical protein